MRTAIYSIYLMVFFCAYGLAETIAKDFLNAKWILGTGIILLLLIAVYFVKDWQKKLND